MLEYFALLNVKEFIYATVFAVTLGVGLLMVLVAISKHLAKKDWEKKDGNG